METRVFRTDLNCGSCIAKVTPFLNSESTIHKWSVDINDSQKPLTVVGGKIDEGRVRLAVEKSGFHVYEELNLNPSSHVVEENQTSFNVKTYYPLILIFTYILGITLLIEFRDSYWSFQDIMLNFMGGFFLVFSFFKLLNLKGFAEAYRTYDVVAKKSLFYSYFYPFIELGLGVAYLTRFAPTFVYTFTFIVMAVSSVGVIQSLMKKRTIQCACLGTIFNLPMTKITLFEDILMAIMAGGMLVV